MSTTARTIEIGHATFLIGDIRAWSVSRPPHVAWPHVGGPITRVWMRDVNDVFLVGGDHAEALRKAVEGLS